MIFNKFTLLAAAAAVGAIGTGAAQAQSVFPAATIHGAGASLPQNVLRQAADCYGIPTTLNFGVASPATPEASKTLFDFDYNTPAADTIGNRFNCAAGDTLIVAPNFGDPRTVQPNIGVVYLSTGSGQGVTAFLNNRVSSNFTFSNGVPYTSADGYQFSASDTALSTANITTYNTTAINPFTRYAAADTAANLFGAPIQFPHIIAPIAIGYAPVYAKVRAGDGSITSYRFTVTGARADGSGGVKLTRAQYCGIMNGTINNWNQLPTKVVNKDVNDPAPFNVPIILVGRSETSGTTQLFTRALARQCSGLSVNTGVGGVAPLTPIANKFGNSENRLPYDASVTIANTAYTGAAGTVSPTNSLSGAFFDKGTGAITVGTEAPGLYTVANGNDGVALATARHPDPGNTPGDRSLNGHVAYISPEQTLPSTLFTNANTLGLNTASLQVNGAGTTFVGPDGKQATAAFVGIAPPQSKGTAGAYCTDAALCPTAYGDRANPLDWVQGNDKSVSLAAPLKGYPIVGTSGILTYTCFSSSPIRQAVNGFFATVVGKTTKTSKNQNFPVGLVADATFGIYARNGLAPMPAAWRTAVAETFLKKSVQPGKVGDATTQLGLRNLWIQDKIPTLATGAGAVTNPNPNCAGKPGA